MTATLTFTIASPTVNTAVPYSATNGDALRMLNALRVYYGQISDGAGGMRDRTDLETVQALFADLRTEIVQRTQVQEKINTQNAQVNNIAPIGLA